MKRFLLLTIFLTLALALSSSSAMAQAAAESVLLNSSSAATTVKAGTSLGSVLNHVTKQLGGQVEQVVTHPATGATVPAKPQTVPSSPKNNAGAEETVPASGPMITSIRGSENISEKLPEKPACTPSTPPASTPDKAAVQSANTNCATTPNDKSVSPKYKSVLTVTFRN
jgi:hypothetical protein